MWPNLMFLMAIAFMPFATAMLGSNGPSFVPSLVYKLSLFACALSLLWVALRVRTFGGAQGSEGIIASAATVVAAALCVMLCWVQPLFSQFGMLAAFAGPVLARRLGQHTG